MAAYLLMILAVAERGDSGFRKGPNRSGVVARTVAQKPARSSRMGLDEKHNEAFTMHVSDYLEK